MNSWPGFEIQREERDDAIWLLVSGELDIGSAAHLDEAMAQAAEDAEEVVVDLAGVTFCDSSGLAVLLRGRRRHATMSLRPGDAVLHVAKLGCVDDVLFGTLGDEDGSQSEDDAASS